MAPPNPATPLSSSPRTDTNPLATDIAARLRNHLTAHPRLFLTRAEEPALQQRLQRDTHLAQLQAHLLATAEAMGQLPPVRRQMEGRRLLAVSRDVLHRTLTLGLAWRLTRQPRYLNAARRVLLDAAAFPDWNPPHFLDVAEMTAALAIGYDWLHDDLSDADRATIRQAILDKGLTPSFTQEQWWVAGANNWNQVCHGGMVLGALAIAEHDPDLCARTLERAVENLPQAMKHYAPDGAYPEGPMYWSYATNFNVMLIAALESALGSDFRLAAQPGFLASADYYLHMTAPSGQFFNYCDCRAGGGFTPSVALFWMAAKRNDPYLLFHQRQALAAALAAGQTQWEQESKRLLPLLLLWTTGPQSPPPPPTTHYVGRGATPVATHRSSWQDDATFIAIKGGSPSTSHAHMDVGAFILESHGVRWACDLGLQEYHSLESIGVNLWDASQGGPRWSIFRLGPRAHNILTVEDQEQVVSGRAPIVHSTPNATAVDCSPVYAGQLHSARRAIVLHEDRTVRLQDDLQALPTQGATIRWAMLTRAQVTIETENSARLTQDGKQLRLTVVAPTPARLKIFATDPAPQPYDTPNPGIKILGFEVTLPPGASQSLIVDFLPALDV